jgi:hypothetical protein
MPHERTARAGTQLGPYEIDDLIAPEEWARYIAPAIRASAVLVSSSLTPDGRSSAYSWHRALSNLYIADGLA